eukprot:gene57524-biopygen85279
MDKFVRNVERGRWSGIGDALDPPLPDPFAVGDAHAGMTNLCMARECARCGERGTKLRRCVLCKDAWYCGRECQQRDYQQHQRVCVGCRRRRHQAQQASYRESWRMRESFPLNDLLYYLSSHNSLAHLVPSSLRGNSE